MDDETNNRRLLMAAGLCVLVMLAWNTLVPARIEKPAPQANAPVATSTSATAAAGEATTTATAAIAAEPAAPLTDVKPETFTFEGSVHSIDTGENIPFKVQLTNVGGGIDLFELPLYKERDRDNRKSDQPIQLTHSAVNDPTLFGQMAGLELADESTFRLPARPIYEVAQAAENQVRYRYVTRDGVEIEREYHFDKQSFQVELAVTIRNRSAARQSYRLQMSSALEINDTMRHGDGFLSMFFPAPDHLKALCHTNGKVERLSYDELHEHEGKPDTLKESVRWAAIDRRYFVSALVPRDGTEAECRLAVKGSLARASLVSKSETLEPGENRRHKYTSYLGIKKPALLTLANAELEEAVDYTSLFGMNLALLCAGLLWVLKLFHGVFDSWGLAILGLTVVVKLMLFPLNQRSGRAMRAMSALKPKLDEIRERFPEDKQRQSEEMMKLYKEHNVNPAGGCLPVLIQMPIWLALYTSLGVSVDLFQQSFLWIPDLTARDPNWILPVVLTIVMFVQQKMMPSTMDPAQQKIMLYTMPLMFGALMMALPAGLSFYILVNTLLTIVQQHLINRSIGPIGGSATVRGATA